MGFFADDTSVLSGMYKMLIINQNVKKNELENATKLLHANRLTVDIKKKQNSAIH